jgi:hypothetical protein
MSEPWTPGPWEVETGFGVRWYRGMVCDLALENAEDSYPVEQLNATARLIAAAPEMADTIADLIDQLRWADEQLGQGQSCGAMADEADTLLARIRGEA